MKYQVKKLAGALTIDANWDKPAWQGVQAVELKNVMGNVPAFLPRTQAKMLYDEAAIYVIFRVEDRYLRAVAQQTHDSVCRDSCVEFFFTPNTDIETGYFNIETNCGGTMLFHFQLVPRSDSVKLAQRECDQITICTNQPKIIDPEVVGPVTWMVEYRLPWGILEEHCKVDRPGRGVRWLGNFYKCGDATSNFHHLTWNPVDRPRPEFHVPTSFGELEFI